MQNPTLNILKVSDMNDPWKEATDWVREEFEREKEKELQDIFAAKEPVDNVNAVQYKQKGEER